MRRHGESEDAGWQRPDRQDRGGRGERRAGRRGGGGDEHFSGRDYSDYRPPDYAAGPRRAPGRSGRAARSTGMTISGIIAGIVVLALVSGSLVLYVKYRSFYDSIGRVDVSGDLNHIKQPKEDPNALNILLIGSDSRAGVNGKIGGSDGIEGQRSDTVMVLHIAPGEHRAVVLSFPRDSVVPILNCTAEAGSAGQSAQPGEVEQINSTFANGGPGCLWETVEQTTDISINDFVELTFIGFEKVINDLGGVNVCLPEAVDDPLSGLNLSAGEHHVGGAQALAFWRTREDLGEGSDLQRIQRDQFLMVALLQGIEKEGLLHSPSELNKVIGDAASNLVTDSGLDQTRMLQVGESLRGLTSQSVQFVEVPTVTYEPNPDWVQWSPQATQLFTAIASDATLPKPVTKKGPAPAPAATVSPSQVNVQVLNGSGLAGVAEQGASDLSGRGFNVTGSGNAGNFNYTKSVVEYSSPADLPAAQTLESEFSNVELLKVPGITTGTVDVVLGSDFSELNTATPTSSSDLTQTYGGITGSTNICQDSSAFSGPDGG
jgi:LCP family protein required for cell wall assembly